MSVEGPDRSLPLRFCDAFLQEENIKWLLTLGLAILIGSSTMLVTTHWHSYTPVWKILVLFSYTFAVHFAGQIAYHRLGLRKTGTSLMALTVLLIPLCFLALRWFHPPGELTLGALLSQVGLLTLLGFTGVCSTLAARRIFGHFLRQMQPTFLACYLILSFSGALVFALPAHLASIAALLMWMVFAAGSISVSRHVFWMTEEHRLPRIFGFFPIFLLGVQFFILFASSLSPHVPVSSIGLGLVLLAIPVLLTADASACEIQKRRGQSSGPLPATVVLPMFFGLCVTLAGVCLASVTYPATGMLVPTTALASVIMAVIARRTGHCGFTWTTLILAAVTYQTSPVFFQSAARTLAQAGAAAVHEERLPLAFYGLTYLPFLIVSSGFAVWRGRRGDKLFAVPLRQVSTGLPLLLLPIAFSHTKAVLPVGLALAGLLGWQLVLFAQRRLLLAALVAFLTAVWGITPFAEDVLLLRLPAEFPRLAWLMAAGLLLVPGTAVDRWTARCTSSAGFYAKLPLCQTASLIVVLLAGVSWVSFAVTGPAAPWSGVVCAGLLFAHALRWRNVALSTASLVFNIAMMALLALKWGWGGTEVVTLIAILIAGLSIAARELAKRPRLALSQVFERPSLLVANGGTILLQTLLIPAMLMSALGHSDFSAYGAAALILVVTAELAWRTQSAGFTVFAWLSFLSLSAVSMTGSFADPQIIRWAPAVWVGIAAVFVPLVRIFNSKSSNENPVAIRSFWSALEWCVGVTLIVISVSCLPLFTLPFRIAGWSALGVSGWLCWGRDRSAASTAFFTVGNLFALTQVLHATAPELASLIEVTVSQLATAALPIAFVSALSSLLWESRATKPASYARKCSVACQCLSLGALLSRMQGGTDFLSSSEVWLVLATCLTLAGLQALLAYRSFNRRSRERELSRLRQRAEIHVWTSEAIILLGLSLLHRFDIISLTSEAALFAPLGFAALAWGVSHRSTTSPRLAFLTRPMALTAELSPAFTVILGLIRHTSLDHVHWHGTNSLALLLAAGYYFWRGLDGRRIGPLIVSAVVLNVAGALLWNELHWTDPQLFLIPLGLSVLGLVELLRDRIPEKHHDPLCYVGALIILVSPTFQIVGGSWIHLICLMAASIVIVLLAMGLRVRALMYTGAAFLVADLLAMLVRGSFDHPNLLWITGIIFGTAVVTLAAYCERHRELMLQRLRFLAARLETWK